jgi:hypothetical protein
MTTKPSDRFNEWNQEIANKRPAGGYIPPTNLKPIPERPRPTKDDFGGYERQ